MCKAIISSSIKQPPRQKEQAAVLIPQVTVTNSPDPKRFDPANANLDLDPIVDRHAPKPKKPLDIRDTVLSQNTHSKTRF